jgi:hypothetical protein
MMIRAVVVSRFHRSLVIAVRSHKATDLSLCTAWENKCPETLNLFVGSEHYLIYLEVDEICKTRATPGKRAHMFAT